MILFSFQYIIEPNLFQSSNYSKKMFEEIKNEEKLIPRNKLKIGIKLKYVNRFVVVDCTDAVAIYDIIFMFHWHIFVQMRKVSSSWAMA